MATQPISRERTGIESRYMRFSLITNLEMVKNKLFLYGFLWWKLWLDNEKNFSAILATYRIISYKIVISLNIL